MRYLVLGIVLFISVSTQAQRDVIILKTGSEIRGTILEETMEFIKVRTKGGSVWVFNKTEVEGVKPFITVPFISGYYGTMTLGAFGGSAFTGNLSVVNGFQFNKHWAVGLGIGIENFYNNLYVPLFIEGKYDFLKKSSTPFVTAGFGYDIPFEITDKNKGGILAQGLIGFKHQIGEHFGIITGLGFRYGRLEVEDWNWWNGTQSSIKTIYEINRFDIRFGFIFR